jgi:hypothetical protein
MDPIHPIAPGASAIPRAAVPPVKRLQRISREGDRPAHDQEERRRRERPPAEPGEEDEDGPRHIDVRA